MRRIILIVFTIALISLPQLSSSGDIVSCTIEKSLSTGPVLEKPMVSTEKINIEVKLFGDSYIFPLSPADAECELRIPSPKGGTFLNCWTLDKKHAFRSDRTLIDHNYETTNTLTYADLTKQIQIKVTVRCK